MCGRILIVTLLVLCTSCGHHVITNEDASRAPSSQNEQPCQAISSASDVENVDFAICKLAQGFTQSYSSKPITAVIDKKFNEELKRNILTIRVSLYKSDVESIMGRGGLRLRYLRYMINESSYAHAVRNTPKEKSDEAIKKFTLVELILNPLDG